ncbi:site-specific integrase [Neptunomonas sp.]|uniref:site-specific integrase n=1 Tax=Neptunomonas sp. TaxID=1971898 RepID=UPI0025DFECC0|nr:site-specific integrase [Neptunomonas sp.]
MSNSPFLNNIRREIRLRGYSLRTEKTYIQWIKRYIYCHRLSHPEEMGTNEVRQFLSWLANEQSFAVNTQKTALNALTFLYHKVLKVELGDLGIHHAKQY